MLFIPSYPQTDLIASTNNKVTFLSAKPDNLTYIAKYKIPFYRSFVTGLEYQH